MNIKHALLLLIFPTVCTLQAAAQSEVPEVYTLSGLIDEEPETVQTDSVVAVESMFETNDTIAVDSVPTFEQLLLIEQERLQQPLEIDTSIDVSSRMMPRFYYMPVVYKPYKVELVRDFSFAEAPKANAMSLDSPKWIDDEVERYRMMNANLQDFCAHYPWVVKLNLESLPEPPKTYVATVDPKTATIKVEELKVNLDEANKEVGKVELKRKNWLHTFNASLHFSQAYNSPNWYQGGNNNLNLIGQFVWNVKLNSKFYPKLLFENTVQYKLAVNSAPDDTLRNYSISEDLFQVNTKFGFKATQHWYYSATMQFKTQLLQNHPTNSHSLTAAFLSPGELNVGLGMTYDRTSANKKATVNISINPLSYNMICYSNTKVTSFGGDKTISQYGSNLEAKLTWKPVYNITYTSRLYAFTNYEYLQGDWEHTISFDINRFLSTQIYAHLRYDSSTKKLEDTKWHRWQLKEILSFGFTYKFSSL